MPRDFPFCVTLIDYRRRYTLYKSDPDLQAAHASCPFLSSFDDHEVINNWAGDRDPKGTPPEDFLFRRAAAFQAWYEHMPVRRSMVPRGPDMLAYRNFQIGNLANIAVLDTRQYRSKQPCGDGIKANCAEADEPGRTMLGEAQERWLDDDAARRRDLARARAASGVLASRLRRIRVVTLEGARNAQSRQLGRRDRGARARARKCCATTASPIRWS